MRKTGSYNLIKRILAAVCVVVIALFQVVFIAPDFAKASAGNLEIRVQYNAERGDKIRTLTTFSRSQLEGMGMETRRYSNITAVGGVMRVVARGPKITTILSNAGIDLGSIDYINFRTTDGQGAHKRYSVNFKPYHYASSDRWYYPYLASHYQRHDDETITPLPAEKDEPDPDEPGGDEPDNPDQPITEPGGGSEEDNPETDQTSNIDDRVFTAASTSVAASDGKGALDDAVRVDAILAVVSYSTKVASTPLDASKMNTSDSYRLCLGQTRLHENVKTTSADVSAYDSAKYIFGIDVVLKGSPSITGIALSADGTDCKVGSLKKVKATITGTAPVFSAQDLTWESNDENIATVDRNGNVKIKGNGAVTITARADNGVYGTITFNGTGEAEGVAGDEAGEDKKAKKEDKKKVVMVAKEITIGDEIAPETSMQNQERAQMAEDSQALEAAEEYDKRTAAGAAATAVAACGLGVVFRVRRFHIDMGKIAKIGRKN